MDLVNTMLLVLSILIVSTIIAYFVQKGTPTVKEFNDKITENLMEEFETKEVESVDEVLKQAEVEKPKKKRKYYPKKPKTEK